MVVEGDDPFLLPQFGPSFKGARLSVSGRVWEGIFSASLFLVGRTVTGRVCQTVCPDQSFEEAIQRECMEFLWIVQSGFAILDPLHFCTMCEEIVQSGTNTKNRSLKHVQDSSC